MSYMQCCCCLISILIFLISSCTNYQDYKSSNIIKDTFVSSNITKAASEKLDHDPNVVYIDKATKHEPLEIIYHDLEPISIDPSANFLPIRYDGDDVIEAFNYLKKYAPQKDKYETTVQYKSRIDTSKAENKLYAFQIMSRWFRPSFQTKTHDFAHSIDTHYDADSQKLKVHIEFRSIKSTRWLTSGYSKTDNASLLVKQIDKKPTYSIDSNAFGVTAEVTTLKGTKFEIALANFPDVRKSFDLRFIVTSSSIEVDGVKAEEARQFDKNIGVLAICRPKRISDSDPLTIEDHDYSEATINTPLRCSYDVKYITVEILEFWVYDMATGRILLKKRI